MVVCAGPDWMASTKRFACGGGWWLSSCSWWFVALFMLLVVGGSQHAFGGWWLSSCSWWPADVMLEYGWGVGMIFSQVLLHALVVVARLHALLVYMPFLINPWPAQPVVWMVWTECASNG
uniref:Candidate secreted effector n=1 Tax=Meloidogyne incognita TaxID=6306 RepID=A0A914MPS8_MELIC